MTSLSHLGEERAEEIAAAVTDPELPMLTLADLGVLREVEVVTTESGHTTDAPGVIVTITPTYSGCPATAAMRDDLVRVLTAAGFASVDVRLRLDPPWTSDWITERGREALRRNAITPPGPAPDRTGPVVLTFSPTRRALMCPRCASPATELVSEFGSTACKAHYRCQSCLEPFDHFKEI